MNQFVSNLLAAIVLLGAVGSGLNGQVIPRDPAAPPIRPNNANQGPEQLALIDDVVVGFESLFNGETLDGWEQKNGTATYEVVDKTILGRTAQNSPNSFLCTIEEYSDFDLRFDVKVDVGLNSGVQIRSLSKTGFNRGRVHGPQVEIESDPGESGYLYSEGTGRGWISPKQPQRNVFKNDGWNSYRVLAEGDRIQTWVNGVQVEDLQTPPVESRQGFIGLQVHGIGADAGPFQVQWKNIRIRELDGSERQSLDAIRGTPTIDGKVDETWNAAPRILTNRPLANQQTTDDHHPATAWVRCLWDDEYLYCLAEVKDSHVSNAEQPPRDQDSVEFFIDENFQQDKPHDSDATHFRTAVDGSQSAGTTSNLKNYHSAVTRTEEGYVIEARFKIKTGANTQIGFEVQVNDGPFEGQPRSVMKWNDRTEATPTDATSADASGLGILTMKALDR